ncbi:DUF1016 N-terminal domain-containing protein [Paeniglutamicibacter sp. NPDC012692]|uniref:DUF1016 N-terminal domain-containing protein n=1 Tax=Paeniglutamicibacter sp. NPDC012692 TaxID=3364388 RepID=UPI0036A8BCBA
MSTTGSLVPDGYAQFLTGLKDHVRSARVQVQRIVNTALIDLYWNIGNRILAEQEDQGRGSSVITRLAEDLRREFPEMTGLSRSNLHYMRAFAAAWPDWNPNVPQAEPPQGKGGVYLLWAVPAEIDILSGAQPLGDPAQASGETISMAFSRTPAPPDPRGSLDD